MFGYYKFEIFIFVVLPLAVLFFSINSKLPEIKGIYSEIEYAETVGEIVISRRIKKNIRFATGVRYNYKIVYSYNVGQNTYTSDLVTLTANHYEVDKYLMKYPLLKMVAVYYDTQNPGYAVLETGTRYKFRDIWGLIVFWIASSIFGVGMVSYLIIKNE